MSKNNPTKAEKCRSTKLSKCDVSTLVGIILRKDAKEKNLSDKVKSITKENDSLNKTISDLTLKVCSLERQLETYSSIFTTNKQILETTKKDNKRLTEHVNDMAFEYSQSKHKSTYMYIVSVILINIAWVCFTIMC